MARPIWTLDVGALGFANPHRPETSTGPFPRDPICYLSGSQIVVTFVTREAVEGIPLRGQPDAHLPFRLHALFVDAMTGQVRTTLTWPTASARSCVFSASQGKFVVFTPDKLWLYSPRLEQLKGLDLPLRIEATWESWELHASPGGRYLLIDYDSISNEKLAEVLHKAIAQRDHDLESRTLAQVEEGAVLLDTEQLRILQTWKVKSGPTHERAPRSVSEEGLVLFGGKVGKVGGPWHLLCSNPSAPPHCGTGPFVNDRTVFSLRKKGARASGFDLIDIRGEPVFSDSFPEREFWQYPVRRSPGGQRFALAFDEGKGGIAALDIAPHYFLKRIVVFDLPTLKWVYRLDGKRQRIASISGLAVSPDGLQLGLIDQNGILRVYRLPESKRGAGAHMKSG